jgi:hypothetical protein
MEVSHQPPSLSMRLATNVAKVAEFLAIPAATQVLFLGGAAIEHERAADHAAQVVERLEAAGMVGATVEAERAYGQDQHREAVEAGQVVAASGALVVFGVVAGQWRRKRETQ